MPRGSLVGEGEAGTGVVAVVSGGTPGTAVDGAADAATSSVLLFCAGCGPDSAVASTTVLLAREGSGVANRSRTTKTAIKTAPTARTTPAATEPASQYHKGHG